MNTPKATPKRAVAAMAALLAAALAAPTGLAAKTAISDEVSLTADFRVRLESDLDGHTAGGASRDDRTRMRIRTRFGLVWAPDRTWSWGVRARTGSDSSHRGENVTIVDFSGNDTGDADFNLDKWYLRAEGEAGWVWAGRNSLPVWTQGPFPWKGAVTPAGVGGSIAFPAGAGDLTLQGGWFSLPVGMREFSGQLGSAQVLWNGPLGESSLVLAGSVFHFDADGGDPDGAALANGNGARDYSVWVASAQIKFDAGQTPVAMGLDLLHNSEDYDPADPDPFTAAHASDVDGHVYLVRVGGLDAPGDWMGGWWYAHVEALATNSSYADGTWVRWGEATDTEGHEFRLATRLSEEGTLRLRVFLVDSLTTPENGTRLRLEYFHSL